MDVLRPTFIRFAGEYFGYMINNFVFVLLDGHPLATNRPSDFLNAFCLRSSLHCPAHHPKPHPSSLFRTSHSVVCVLTAIFVLTTLCPAILASPASCFCYFSKFMERGDRNQEACLDKNRCEGWDVLRLDSSSLFSWLAIVVVHQQKS